MPTPRKQWINNLISDAEFLAQWADGWKVVKHRNGGAKVTAADGALITIPGTHTSRTTPPPLLAELRRHGWDDAKSTAILVEARAVLGDDQRETTRAQNRATTAGIRSAAGQRSHQPAIADLVTPQPAVRVWSEVDISPPMAEKLLGLNTANRPRSKPDIDAWCGVLARGEWLYTHQGIAISRDGVLLDGQTRLAAIAKSGITAPMQVTVGVPPEAFDVMDTQRRRTVSQLLTARGEVSATALQALTRLMWAYDHGDPRDRGRRLSNLQLMRHFQEHADDLRTAILIGGNATKPVHGSRLAAAGAVYLIRRKVGDDARLTDLLTKVADGEHMGREDPPMALRRWILNQSRTNTAPYEMGVWLKAWRDYCTGTPVKQGYKMREDEGFPEVYGEAAT